jgi:hypothetical protein
MSSHFEPISLFTNIVRIMNHVRRQPDQLLFNKIQAYDGELVIFRVIWDGVNYL